MGSRLQEDPQRGKFLSLLLVLLFSVGFLVVLVFLTNFFFLNVLITVAGISAVGLLHYVVWGESLSREVAEERAAALEEQERERLALEREHPYGIRPR